MNKKQLTICWIGLIIFLLMGLYPPWVRMYETGESTLFSGVAVYKSAGYSFILTPPYNAAWLDLTRLIPQWLMLSVLTALIVYLKGDKNLKAKNTTL